MIVARSVKVAFVQCCVMPPAISKVSVWDIFFKASVIEAKVVEVLRLDDASVVVVLGGIVLAVLLAALGLDGSSEGFTMSVASIEWRTPGLPED